MRYSLYVDRLFLLHFGMEVLLLWLTALLAQMRLKRRRLLLCAALGAAGSLALLLWGGPLMRRPGWRICLMAVKSLLLVQVAFGLQEKKALRNALGWYAAASLLLGGALTAWDGLLGAGQKKGALQIWIPAAVAAAVGGFFLKKERRQKKELLCTVRLREGDRETEITAFWDSGNGLRDPISGRPVCVAERAVLEELGLLNRPERIRAIPYHSVGRAHGILYAAEVERLYIRRNGQEIEKRGVLIAASGQRLSARGTCRMLLHPTLLEEKKGENHDIESRDAGKDAV